MSPRISKGYISRRLREDYQPNFCAFTDGYAQLALTQSGEPLKRAAVLMPLARREGEWYLLFTRRTNLVESHKGQVSFPGGECGLGEYTPEQTALREAEEEIGLHPQDVRVLGRLNDVVTITHYRVTPVVGVIPWPYEFQLARVEVARVFAIPMLWLTQRENWEEYNFMPDGAPRPFPVITYHPYDGEILWGASARMTQNFLMVLGLLDA